jgi:YesN/AraC family two-component response regulator
MSAPDTQDQSLAMRADEYIVTHFHEPISASDVAEHLTCNPDYLGRVYRKARRMTLTDAINKKRVQFSKTLLLDSVMNVDQIAAASGFQDAGYFRRMFRRAEGVSPLSYRRLYAQLNINTE